MRVTFFLVVIAAAIFALLVRPDKSRPTPSSERVLQVDPAQEAEVARSDAENSGVQLAGAVELHRHPDGHFYADVEVNGSTLHMLVDTGATQIALSREDARSAGLPTSIGMNDVVGRGADGDVHGEITTLDRVSLGQKTVEGLPVVILNSGEQSLLGQSFLSKFGHVEIEGDKMLLQ
jgi:aspartyl protease family protein